MHTYGNLFKIQTWGASHTAEMGVVINGVPPGIPISTDDFLPDLLRRKAGAKGTTPRLEDDIPEIKAGVFNAYTTGAPIHISFKNKAQNSKDYMCREFSRPGHADFVADKKYKGFQDSRGGGFFSGRMSVLLVAAGVLAKKILGDEIKISAEITEIGGSKDFDAVIENAIKNHDSLGARVQCTVNRLPIGWGEPVFNSVESLISHLVFAIPGAKAIAFGSGFEADRMTGSEYNDCMIDETGKTETNHNGGINGGISNGNPLEFSVNFKPTPSIAKAQKTWNPVSGQSESMKIYGKHDVCYALRTPVIVEAVTAIVLAELSMYDKAQNING